MTDRTNRNIIGPRVRLARLSEKPKATLADISARLEVLDVKISVNFLGKIENGWQSVTDKQLYALARVLKVTPNWLLGWEEKE